jgi:hypothetical protein
MSRPLRKKPSDYRWLQYDAPGGVLRVFPACYIVKATIKATNNPAKTKTELQQLQFFNKPDDLLLDFPLPNPNKPVDRPFRVLAVPSFVFVLALTPLLLMLIQDLPPMRACGLDTFHTLACHANTWFTHF